MPTGRWEGELGMRIFNSSHCKFTFIDKLGDIVIPIYYESRIQKQTTKVVQ